MDLSTPVRAPLLQPPLQAPSAAAFRQAFRRTACGVWVVTVDHAGQRSGFTATSIISLSSEPAELMLSMQPSASSFPLLQASGRFGVNLLAQSQQAIAARFTGQDGSQGEARFAEADWRRTPTGVWLLGGANAALACELHELLWRRTHALVIGRITAVQLADAAHPPLVYTDGSYARLSPLQQ